MSFPHPLDITKCSKVISFSPINQRFIYTVFFKKMIISDFVAYLPQESCTNHVNFSPIHFLARL